VFFFVIDLSFSSTSIRPTSHGKWNFTQSQDIRMDQIVFSPSQAPFLKKKSPFLHRSRLSPQLAQRHLRRSPVTETPAETFTLMQLPKPIISLQTRTLVDVSRWQRNFCCPICQVVTKDHRLYSFPLWALTSQDTLSEFLLLCVSWFLTLVDLFYSIPGACFLLLSVGQME